MNENLTHAYVHLLADVHSGSFAPAFTLSLVFKKNEKRFMRRTLIMGFSFN